MKWQENIVRKVVSVGESLDGSLWRADEMVKVPYTDKFSLQSNI